MHNFIIYFTLILNLIFGNIIQDNNNDFKSYIKNFKSLPIPSELNLRFVSRLSTSQNNAYKTNQYISVKEEYLKYIPQEIQGDNDEFNYRCVYFLPKKDDFFLVIVIKDYLKEDEYNEKLELFLISYNSEGEIIDYVDIAGFQEDTSERSVSITKDYRFISCDYIYREHPNEKLLLYDYMIETKNIYRVKEDGTIFKMSESKIEGYFDENENGYFLKK